jgi:hypothetical protein
MNGKKYKEEYEEIKNDPNVTILHDSISPSNTNKYNLKDGMKVPHPTIGTATISWITGAGEVFFEEENTGFMYDYEVAQDILVKKHGKKKAMKKWKKKYRSIGDWCWD